MSHPETGESISLCRNLNIYPRAGLIPAMGLSAGIYGGSGYVGVELVRLLGGHPEVGSLLVASRGHAGRRIGEVYPQVAVGGEYLDPAEVDASGLDVAFVAYGHGESAETVSYTHLTLPTICSV